MTVGENVANLAAAAHLPVGPDSLKGPKATITRGFLEWGFVAP